MHEAPGRRRSPQEDFDVLITVLDLRREFYPRSGRDGLACRHVVWNDLIP